MLFGEKRFPALYALLMLTFCICSQLPAQERTTSASKVVATVGGQSITDEELAKAAASEMERLELQKLQYEAGYLRNRHQVLENSLDQLIEDKLVAAEAAKQGISPLELLAKEVEERVKPPSPEEVDAFYETNKGRIKQPKDKVQPQIVQFLQRQSRERAKAEFIKRLKLSYPTTSHLDPLRTHVETVGHPFRGPASAPVTIVEFSDFQCSFCKTLYSTLREIQKNYPTAVRLVYRQYPIAEIHPHAMKAAEASLCADEQGRFWDLHDQVFQDQGSLREEDLTAKAAKLQLNTEVFNKCLNSGKHAARIAQDLREGAAAGVSGTPALFINGRFVSGAQPYAEISKIIDDELQRAGGKH